MTLKFVPNSKSLMIALIKWTTSCLHCTSPSLPLALGALYAGYTFWPASHSNVSPSNFIMSSSANPAIGEAVVIVALPVTILSKQN